MTSSSRIETSCDDTCAAVVDRRRRDPRERHLLPGRPRPLRRRRARGRLAPPPRAGERGRRRRAARAPGATLDDVDLVAVTQGPGLVGALLVGVATAKALAAARGLPLAPVDHLQGHVAANFLGPDAARAAVPVPGRRGGHTFLARVDDHDALHGPGRDARRRRGRGVRQGRAAARPAVPRRPAPRAPGRARATRRPSRSRPPRGVAGPGLLLRRA